jgi:hypothetical protein
MNEQATLAVRAAVLAERASGPPPETWRPDKPELVHPNPLAGELVRVYLGPDRGWGEKPIAEIRDAQGIVWAVWCLGHILEQELGDPTRLGAPQPGDVVAVFFEGKRRAANPKPGTTGEYSGYRVLVDPSGRRQQPQPAPFAGGGESEPAVASANVPVCAACGYTDGNHAQGCPEELPF